MRLWPVEDSWIITLYGVDKTPPDVLFIGIDDEQGVGFLSHIEPILNVCRQYHPESSFWFLFLTSPTFECWRCAIDSFDTFISTNVETLLRSAENQAKSLGADATFFNTNMLSFPGLKSSIINAPVKIWLVDLLDANNNHQDSITLINDLSTRNENVVLFSQQQLGELVRIIHEIKIQYYFQKQLYINNLSVEVNVYPRFAEFIPDKSLLTVLPTQWHQIRHQIGSSANQAARSDLRSCHHWGDNPGICEGGKNGLDRTAADTWRILNNVSVNAQTLQGYLKDGLKYGAIYEKVMFSSQTLRPAIRELLQTCNCAKNLTKYIDRMKEHLEKHGQRLTPKKIEVSIPNRKIIQDYLWFNVAALNAVLRLVINSYEDELNKPAYSAEHNGKTIITFNEIDNGRRKGLEVMVKEDPSFITDFAFPYRDNLAIINDGIVKDILKDLHKYLGVDDIYYKAMSKCRKIDIGCVLNNSSGCITDNISDNDDFTFKWLIEAQEVDEPYNCGFMPVVDERQKCWTIKKGCENE